jgi:hypothetical protein
MFRTSGVFDERQAHGEPLSQSLIVRAQARNQFLPAFDKGEIGFRIFHQTEPMNADEQKEGEELIRRLEDADGARCAGCGRGLCAHHVLVSIGLGFGNAPRCLACTSKAMEQSPEQVAQSLFAYFKRRTCYWTAWNWAGQREGVATETIPDCLLSRKLPS